MTWNNIKAAYGLRPPFDFKIAVPLMLSACLFAIVLILCLGLFLSRNLSVGTERFFFFIYILSLLMLAAALSKSAGGISYALMTWCLVEIGLAISSSLTSGYGVDQTYFPEDRFTQPDDPRFVYHPLLQQVPKRNVQWKSVVVDPRNRSVMERFAFAANWPMAWNEFEGKEFVFSQNSFGLRGREPRENDLKKNLIFVYGGSTTYDVSVSQGETWVEQLQADLNNRYTILNFGVPAYSTTENLIQTAFYQGIVGKTPVCAIYYVGWNDIHNAHINGLDSAYADFHLPLTAVRRPDFLLAKYSPVMRLVSDVARRRFDSLPRPKEIGRNPVVGRDDRLEDVFLEHINTIKAINESRGVKTIFVGQLLNREFLKYTPEKSNWWTPLVRNEDVWPLQEHFNHLLEGAASSSLNVKYIDTGIDNFNVNDFMDPGHFSPAGAKKFALLLSRGVDEFCR